jgi:sterol desaturase/sphingolipid hydroxylase (fatty acid hydroxylase superfamily)
MTIATLLFDGIALTAVLAIAYGAFSWSLAEYVLHRFFMHQLWGKGIASREHLLHHAGNNERNTATILSWVGVVLVGIGIVGPIAAGLASLVGLPWQVAMLAGPSYIASYGFYDWMHWRAHHRYPATAYERWLRHHHFHHHFGHPLENHGVTSHVWDHVFGTYAEPGTIKVPRRLAMVWLTDDDGAVRPELAHQYVLAGSSLAPRLDEDHERAFKNLAPTA